jgi:hypothetical protein
MSNDFNGLIMFYINYRPEDGEDVKKRKELLWECNKEIFDKIQSETSYRIAVVPTTKESCRVEKMDFDKPYPRYLAKTHGDIGEEERRRKEKERLLLLEQEKKKTASEGK